MYSDSRSVAIRARRASVRPAPLHVVEELFVYDLAVDHFIDGHLFHCESSALRFEGDVQFENHREMRSRHQWAFHDSFVDFVIRDPPLALGFYGRNSLGLARLSGRCAGFHADDIVRIEGFQGLLELALRAVFDKYVRNFFGSHYRSPQATLSQVFMTGLLRKSPLALAAAGDSSGLEIRADSGPFFKAGENSLRC